MKIKIIILFFLWWSGGVLSYAGTFNNAVKDKKDKRKPLTEQQQLEFNFAFAEAVKFVLLGEVEKGMSLYAACLKIDPNSAVVHYELANIYMAGNNINSALELSRKAAALEPGNLWYQLQLANIYQKKGMIDSACKVYKELTERYPERTDFYYLEAGLYASVEKYKKAAAVYDRLEKKRGIQEAVSMEKERLYLKMGNKRMAYSELNKLIKKFPHNANLYGILADLYIADKKEDKAFEQYQKILKMDPDNGLVHFYLADYYRKRDDWKNSRKSLKTAMMQSEVSSDQKIQYLVTLLMADKEKNLGDDYVQELLDELTSQYPNNVRLNALYADFLRKRNENKKAREYLRKVLNEDKSNYVVWEELLLVDNALLDFEDMYKVSSQALEYFPNYPFFYMFKGVSALQQKKYDIAVEAMEKGAELAGSNVKLRLQFKGYLGDAYHEKGENEKAFKAYDEVLMFEPDNVLVLNNYAYYLSEEKKELEKADKMASHCIELEPNNSTYLDTYAWVLYQQGKYEKAKKIMERSLENGGDKSAVLLEHYGDILFRLGEKDKAVEAWKKADKLGKGTDKLKQKIKTGRL